MDTLSYCGTLRTVTCWCGIKYAIPEELCNFNKRKRANGESQVDIYCPLGHTWIIAGEPRIHAVERQLQSERQRHDQTKAALREETNKLNAEKAAKTRIRNRVQGGVCIHCRRTFKQLAAHMRTKHSDCMKGK